MTTLKPDEIMYALYMRHLPDGTEWVEQETTGDEDDARYWLKRNTERNAIAYEAGTGREYVLIKKSTSFELLSPIQNLTDRQRFDSAMAEDAMMKALTLKGGTAQLRKDYDLGPSEPLPMEEAQERTRQAMKAIQESRR